MENRDISKLSQATINIVNRVDADLDLGCNSFYYYRDASVKDVVDALDYILNETNWFGSGYLYARKVVSRNMVKNSDGSTLTMGIQITTKKEDFDDMEKMNSKYVIHSFPMIVACKKKDKSSVYLEENNVLYTYKEWIELHNMDLKPADPVVICRPNQGFPYNSIIETAYYTGTSTEDIKTNQKIYLLSGRLDLFPYHDDTNELVRDMFYAKHGRNEGFDYSREINDTTPYFLTIPEYRFHLSCYFEALEKGELLLKNDCKVFSASLKSSK